MDCEHAASVPVGFALRACPFLKAVAAKEGDDFAARFSVAPLVPAAAASSAPRCPPLEEQAAFAGFASSYSFFHGEGGVVPLVKTTKATTDASAAASRCPFFHAVASFSPAAAKAAIASESKQTGFTEVRASSAAWKAGQAGQEAAREVRSSLPSPPCSSSSPSLPLASSSSALFASISLRLFSGGMPDGGEWVRRLRRHQQQQQRKSKQQKQNRQRKPGPPAGSSPSSGPPSSSGNSSGGGAPRGPAPPRVASRAPPSLRPRLPPRSNNGNKKSGGSDKGATSSSSASEPRCPLRDWPVLGAVLPLAAGGEALGLNCPRAIVALRAAVARVPQVRGLRPRPLWLKGAAVAAAGAAANAPFGAWRHHTKKFSLEWFVAVHATVPFVAALRQATLLPRWALVLTVAGAVAGQMLGARVEAARVAAVEEGKERRRKEEEEEEEAAAAAAKEARRWLRRRRRPSAPAPANLRSGGGAARGTAWPFGSQCGSSLVVV